MNPIDLIKEEHKADRYAYQDGYDVYRRILENDYLSHSGVTKTVKEYIEDHISGSFSFIDLGCGDAEISAKVLTGTRVDNYIGIDIIPHSLDLAHKNMEHLKCPKTFIFEDYTQAILNHPEIVGDVIWVGLSLHQFLAEEKSVFLKNIYNNIKPRGTLLLYEHISKQGQTREEWFNEYFNKALPQWNALSHHEINRIVDHMRDDDHPETFETYRQFGEAAGFHDICSIYTEPNGGFQVLRFQK